MRATAFCLLALLAFVANARDLEQATDTTCLTESVASLVLLGSGGGRAQAVSFCMAEAEARSQVEEIISNYVASVFDNASEACKEEVASEAATAMAQAVARAYASVGTTVVIEGEGEACAQGFAGGDAFALAIVDIIVELSVKLIEDNFPGETYGQDVKDAVDSKNEASGESIGRAVAVIISDAWAAAADESCTTGGFASGFEVAFVESTTTAIASLWATVVVELCSKFSEADNDGLADWEQRTSQSVSDVLGAIDVMENVIASSTPGGAVEGGTEEVSACAGSKKTRCCDIAAAKERDSCSCGRGCTLREVTSSVTTTGGTKVWVDTATQETCFCPP